MTIWTPRIQTNGEPLYKGLADAIERAIAESELKPGERLPTHRDLADALELNVSTITRGYQEAEKRGLVTGTVGRGTFVSSDAVTSTSLVSFEPNMPGMVEMGLVAPLSRFDPDVTEGFRRMARRKDPTAFLRYSDPRGMPEHRRAGANWAGRYGLSVTGEDVIVCAGAQHGLTCCLTALFRPGDRIATDALTYPGFKALAAMLGIRLVPVAMDEQGMFPEALDTACRRDEIKGVYVMPGVQNPTTATMSEPRRDEIARLAEKHGLVVIEDDAYDLTGPEGTRPVSDRVPHRSVFIAGMSKSLAAGLRVAFLVAPRPYHKPLAQSVLNTVWMAPPLNVELAAMWIKDGTADAVVENKRQEASRRYMVACDELEGMRFRGKRNGFFLWLELPDGWTGQRLEEAAHKAGINVFGAEKFGVGEKVPPAARISITAPADRAELRWGLRVIKQILES